MGTFLVRILVVLTALSSSCSETVQPSTCKDEKVKLLQDLAGIQRGAGEALKEMAQTQRQKKVDQCQTLEESQRELGLKLTQLEGRMDQGRDINLLLNRVAEAIEAKKVEKCQSQTLEAKQSELILALNTLTGRLVQGLEVTEAKVNIQVNEVKNGLRAMQAGYEEGLERVEDRLEAMEVSNKEASKRIEALELKMDTQMNETKDELREVQASYQEGLGRVQDRLEAMEVSNQEASKSIEALEQSVKTLQTLEKNITHALKNLTDRLGVIEAKVDTQADDVDQVKANQASCEKGLQAGKQTLKAMQEKLTGVVARLACQPPFERVGDDCVHFHDKLMNWTAARRYCQDLGGDLLVPSDKQGFFVDSIYRKMSGPYPPLIDVLERERKPHWSHIAAYLGGSVDGDGKATWISGEEAKGTDFKPHECVGVELNKDRSYYTWSHTCNDTRYPLCQ